MNSFMLALALTVIAILAGVAAYLHWRLYKVRRVVRQQQKNAEDTERLGRNGLNKSIQVIARSLVAGQVEKAEASVRLVALMNRLQVDTAVRQELAGVFQLAAAIEHIPRLEAWNALPAAQRQIYQLELESAEAKWGDFVLDAAKKMEGRQF